MHTARRKSPANLTGSLLASLAVVVFATKAEAVDESIEVRVGPMTTVVEREGITGAGWAVVIRPAERRTVELIYPNHPDDFGATAGTACSRSVDDGATWTQAEDDRPIAGMADLWQDRLPDGSLVAIGIRHLPDPKLRAFANGPQPPVDACIVGSSLDEGQSWKFENSVLRCPAEVGLIARPLPHLLVDRQGIWLMPAYAWSRSGNRSVFLESSDRGLHWDVRGTPATVGAILEAGANVTTPWLETAVVRTSNGSLQAIGRTGSSEQAFLVATRSADDGRTWAPVERLLAGASRQPVAGKLPNLLLLPNGALTLLTAQSKLGCRLYISVDGTGRLWSEAHVLSTAVGSNTSMICLDDETLLVFMPSNKRITCRKVTVRRMER
jgi:hypothetical protein